MISRHLDRLRFWAHWRCVEPVLVFESDDWGLERRACSSLLRQYGVPGEWADEQLETPHDLAQLFKVLEHLQDPDGRPASFTANVVVANPDYDAIAGERFMRYHDLPVSQLDGLERAWQEGIARRVFFPQYHGRAHFWPDAWLHDLRSNIPGARAMFDRRYPGGLSLLQEQGWRYHSEYLGWTTAEQRPPATALDWLARGLAVFEQIFGFVSRSTIAPHYIITPPTIAAWRAMGIQFAQGANYRLLRRADGQRWLLAHTLGERSPEGLTFMIRNALFDPRPQRPTAGVGPALEQITRCFLQHIPAIVDTHRINYTGAWGGDAIRALAALLDGLRPYRPRILTSTELGEAMRHDGTYHDVWTGAIRRLTPLDPPWRRGLRAWLSWYHTLQTLRPGRH